MEDLNAILQQLVQFKTSTPIAKGTEEKERGEEEVAETVDPPSTISALEQSVVDMVRI